MREITYKTFSPAEWTAYPKDHFTAMIRAWCELHGFTQHVRLGERICTKLPYSLNHKAGIMSVAEDFLLMVEKRRSQER